MRTNKRISLPSKIQSGYLRNFHLDAGFQSTLPLRGATDHRDDHRRHDPISIHASLAGSDNGAVDILGGVGISIHASLAGSDDPRNEPQLEDIISIHASLAGSDDYGSDSVQYCRYFNPRSPCGERPLREVSVFRHYNFNPRSPCGERRWLMAASAGSADFNPRSPCGERRERMAASRGGSSISIHAPLAGSDRRS